MTAGPPLQEVAARPAGDPPVVLFIVALVLTVGFLLASIWSGKTSRRRAHVVLVSITVLLLVVAIMLAERVGSYWTFPRVPLVVHLSIAYTASITAIVVVVSGILHIRNKITRHVHAKLAWLFVACAVLAICTGILIFLVGEPK